MSPCPLSDINLKVKNLLDIENGRWREDLLRDMIPLDVDIVRDNPISSRGGSDTRSGLEVRMVCSESKMSTSLPDRMKKGNVGQLDLIPFGD